MKWENIIKEFFEKFCTQRWINKWTKDLEGRKQGPNETIDSYYTTFKKLLVKADIDGTMNDKQKLRYFIRDLGPQIAPIVSMMKPATISDALKYARQYEEGQDIHEDERPPATKNYKTSAPKHQEEAMDSLIKKFEQMQLNLAEQIQAFSV